MTRRIPGRTRFAVLAMLALLAAQSQPASAQLFWDWGGKEESNGSGREVIRFNSKYTPGQIIVSFGDRRLYLITRAGEAISYPVAIPREQDRWQGVTKVSDKKVNPAWRPTPDMLRENPKLPSWVPGGHPMNPLGRARALSRLQHLPHSWHRRAVDDRHGGLEGLHPHVQSRRARPLSARAGRHQGHGDVAALRRRGLRGFGGRTPE